MGDYRRHETLSPLAPVPATNLATMGDLKAGIGDHKVVCTAEQSETHQKQWGEITNIKIALEGINARLRTVVVALMLGIPLVGSAGVLVAKYAIVGAVTLELDRRLPPVRSSAQIEPPDAGAPPQYAMKLP
jgi:hypothetical protein